jgi:DNA-binding CsgD family transcriptional regulator
MNKPKQIQIIKDVKPYEFIITQGINEEDIDYRLAEELANEISILDKLSLTCFTMFDYFKSEFYYISENTQYFKNVNNYDKKAYEFLLDNMDNEDIFILYCIQKQAFSFILKQKPEERKNFIFTFNIRMLVNGEKADTTCCAKPQLLDRNGKIWIILLSLEPAQCFTKPHVNHMLSGELDFFKPLSINLFRNYNKNLTPKEIIILDYLSKGDAYEKICKRMKIKLPTLKMHRWKIYRKLGVDTKISAINKAFIFGLID